MGSTGILSIMYDGLQPAEKFFGRLESFFSLNDTPLDEQFKIAWSRLTGKAKDWAKLNITPGITATYTH